jgi:hypothetical protein
MDKNLKYAIIGSMIIKGLYSFDVTTFFNNNLNKKYDQYAKYNWEPHPEIERFFLNLSLDELNPEKLTAFNAEADDVIYKYIWNQWDGEDNYFDITSLNGIEICKNVERIQINLSQIVEFSPLKCLRKLKELRISNTPIAGKISTLSPLFELQELELIELSFVKIKDIDHIQKEIELLKEKDINITLSAEGLS